MSQAWHGGQLERAAKTYGIPSDKFLDFSTNTNPFAPEIPPELWANWREEAAHYPEPAADAVRSRLAEVFSMPENCLLPTAGGIEAIYLAARLFTGKNVSVPVPAFSDYQRALNAAGARVQTVPLSSAGKQAPFREIAEQTAGFDAVFFGNPNNPTGFFYSREEMMDIIRHAGTNGQSWVVDEAFVDFVSGGEGESLRSVIRDCPNLIVAGSLTKFWSIPGLRLGFLATGNEAWHDTLAALQPPWSVSALGAAWTRDCLTPQTFRQLRACLPAITSLRRDLSEALHAHTPIRACPSHTNFLLLDLLQTGQTSGDVTDQLGRQGILVRNCDSFEGIESGRFLRVQVREAADNAILLALLKRLKRR